MSWVLDHLLWQSLSVETLWCNTAWKPKNKNMGPAKQKKVQHCYTGRFSRVFFLFFYFFTCGGSKGRGSVNVSLKLQPCAQILRSDLLVLFSVLLGIKGDKRLVLSDNGSSNLSLVRLALEHRDRAEVQPLSWGKSNSYLSCFNISLLTSLLTSAFVLVLGQDQ